MLNVKLTKQELQAICDKGLATGADFVELFFEDTIADSLQMTGGKITDSGRQSIHGVAVRLLKGEECVNGYTNDMEKVGELTDAQLEKGLNEKNVNARILEARAEKNAAKAKKLFAALAEDGIVYYDENGDVQYNYSRDTSWVAVLDTMQFLGTTNPDSICYVPYGNGAKFELATGCDSSNKSGTKIYLFEAKTLYKTYLQGVNKDELANIIDDANKLGRYAGLKVGDAEVGNNNAGNWE